MNTPTPHSETHPECAAVLATWQASLDGELVDSTLIERHIAQCPHCRTLVQAIEKMRRAITQAPTIVVPGDMATRLTSQVLFDRRHRQSTRRVTRTVLGVCAAAAAVFLAVWLGRAVPNIAPFDPPEREHEVVVQPPTAPEIQAKTPPIEVAMQSGATPSLRSRLLEAGSTMVSRATDDAFQHLPATPNLVPELPSAMIPEWSLEPATQALDDAANGASSAFEPVTSAASRAFGFFYREFGAPMNPERKSGF